VNNFFKLLIYTQSIELNKKKKIKLDQM